MENLLTGKVKKLTQTSYNCDKVESKEERREGGREGGRGWEKGREELWYIGGMWWWYAQTIVQFLKRILPSEDQFGENILTLYFDFFKGKNIFCCSL